MYPNFRQGAERKEKIIDECSKFGRKNNQPTKAEQTNVVTTSTTKV